MGQIAVVGTFDTKGAEHEFLAEQIRLLGHKTITIDTGFDSPQSIAPDVTSDEVANAGGIDISTLRQKKDRGEFVQAMGNAAATFLTRLFKENRIDGVVSLGGSGGTSIATTAMRSIPIGIPKVMMSTLAAGNVAPYVGTSDIVMMPSIVDVAGLNRVSKLLISNAAGAISGMVSHRYQAEADRPLVVASMFGNTTDCVNMAREILEKAGYEVIVFHATGTGGRAMEDLIKSGLVAGVLDLTTTEIADEIVGGILSAGPERLDATATAGVPAVIAPGCLDMVNFGERSSVPSRFKNRLFYEHNQQVTLMRTSAEECEKIADFMLEKISKYSAPVSLIIPQKAISVISAAGQPFHDPAADQILFEKLSQLTNGDVIRLDEEINSKTFATECANRLLALMTAKSNS